MIKAFGTSPCYFDGRDEGISDPKHITWWCLLLDGASIWPRILETCYGPFVMLQHIHDRNLWS
jgi:hypothetical protein